MSEKKDHNLNSPSKFNDEMKTIPPTRKLTELEKAQMSPVQALVAAYGLPRLIITLFLILLFILAPFSGADFATQISNVIARFSWNAVLVLAMVPMVHSGCGLNFGLQLGILAGLLGGTLAIQLGFTGGMCFFIAILIATPFAILFGGGYGMLLNKIKGGEMMVATYVGFSSVSFMCMVWLFLPYTNPTLVMAYTGEGLKQTIPLDNFYADVLANFLKIDFNSMGTVLSQFLTRFGLRLDLNWLNFNLVIPTGSILFFALLAFGVWAFLHTKTGTAMTAVGSNPTFAKASGINIDRSRTLSVILSTWLGAVGILVYQQGFGFVQAYNAPLNMALPAVSAILIGGASVNKASIANVVIGTFLFQGLVTMTPTVMNSMLNVGDMSEVIRVIVSQGMIIYALTRKTEGSK